jgi:hypothetical protein
MKGTCKLCLTADAELRDSHFTPKSTYGLFHDGTNEPVRFVEKSLFPSSKQVKDYVFCGDCEQLFNREGENWFCPLLPTVGGPFPLRERVMKGPVLYRDETTAVFQAANNPEVDTAKLTHFALGMFYKAAVHSWKKDAAEPHMLMEPENLEAIRQYLLGQSDLPKRMALCITVDSLTTPLQMSVQPYRMEDAQGLKRYVFYLAGVLFQLFVGEDAAEKNVACFGVHPGRPIWMQNVSIVVRDTSREEFKGAKRTKKLEETLKDLDEKGLSIRLGG